MLVPGMWELKFKKKKIIRASVKAQLAIPLPGIPYD